MIRFLIGVVISSFFFVSCEANKQELGENTFPDLKGGHDGRLQVTSG